MRYQEAHAAKSGSVPFMLRGPKSVRTILAATVAGAIGLVPTFMGVTPAMATVSTVLTIADVSATEGSDLTFTLHYTGGVSTPATYTLTTGGGTATAGTDYTAPSGSSATVSFTGTADKTVTIHTTDDSIYEANETFTLTATNGSDVATATGTIYDNDNAPSYTLTASPTTVSETASTPSSTISATLSAVSGLATTITLNTADGTAKAGTNYTALTGSTIVVPAGQLAGSTTVPVSITNDMLKDATDTMSFTVNGLADNASPRAATASVSITDAQTTPKLVLSGGSSGAEGTSLTYTVTATPASALPITVKWDAVATTPATGHDAATTGDDFTYPSARTVTIPAGQASATFSIPLINDGINENPEDFAVQISAPTNADLGATTKVTSVITDANSAAAPTVTVTPVSVTEGNSGRSTKTFTATLNQKSGRTVKVGWSTADQSVAFGHAVAGLDYVSNSGTLTFPAGTLTQTFTVDIIGDTIDEGDGETFNINLTSADATANISGTQSTPITITDDDATPTMTLDDQSMKEGDTASAVLFPVKLSNASDHPITFNITDSTGANSGTATAGITSNPGSHDYDLLNAATLVIPAGSTTGYIVVLDNGDKVFEGDETAYFTAATDSGSTAYVSTATKTAKLTLQNDDMAPNLEVNSTKGKEGDTVAVTGTVTGVAQAASYAILSYAGASVKGSKAADANDFTNPGNVPVTIPIGTPTGGTIALGNLVLSDDTTSEPAETILVSGTGINNSATVTDGVITIEASDGGTTPPPPTDVTPTISVPEKVIGAVAVPITGKAKAGATVELWGAPVNSSSKELTKITETTATSGGTYSFSRWIAMGYKFNIKVGEWVSETQTVWVQQDPVFVASSTSPGLVKLTVQGNPRDAGQTVIVQNWTGGKWVNAWRGMTGTNNQWTTTVKAPSKSKWTLRAFVAGVTDDGILPGYSDGKTITVK